MVEPDSELHSSGMASNAVAVVAVAVGAGAAGAAVVPHLGLVAAPFGAAAVALGVVAVGEARRRGRRGTAIAGIVLGGVALLASAAWWAGAAGLMGPFSGARVAEERAEVDALEVSPAPSSETVATPSPADVDAPDAPVNIDDGTGQASLTVAGDTVELELIACATGGRMTDRYLRGEGPDGRVAVHSSRSRTLLAVDTEADRHVLVGQRRGGQASGPGDEGVELEVAGEMRELLTGEVVDVELAASCR